MRDMHHAQFRRQLRIRGFVTLSGAGFRDLYWTHPDVPGMHFGAVVHSASFRVLRRETLNRLIRDLEEARARRARKVTP